MSYEAVTGDGTLREVVAEMVVGTQAAEGSLLLVDGETALRFVVAVSPHKDQLEGEAQPLARGITSLSFQFGQPMVVNDVSSHASFDPSIDALLGETTQSLAVCPVGSPEGELGVLTAYNSTKPMGFAGADLMLLEEFAVRVGERLAELGVRA